MNFYGTMIISPVNKPSYEVDAEWTFIDGIWYGGGSSYPAEICKRKEDAE